MNTTGEAQVSKGLASAHGVDCIARTLEDLTMDFYATTAVLDGEKHSIQFIPGLKLGFTHSGGSAPVNASWQVVSNISRDESSVKVEIARELVTAGFFLGDVCTLPLAP